MTAAIANAVFLRSKAGKENALAVRLEELATASRSDSGVIIYDLHRSAAEPASWFLYERYESQAHFDRHRKNPVLRRFVDDAATLLDGKLDVRMFNFIDNKKAVRKQSASAHRQKNHGKSEVR